MASAFLVRHKPVVLRDGVAPFPGPGRGRMCVACRWRACVCVCVCVCAARSLTDGFLHPPSAGLNNNNNNNNNKLNKQNNRLNIMDGFQNNIVQVSKRPCGPPLHFNAFVLHLSLSTTMQRQATKFEIK